ncbi:hypothetical protein KR044_003361 [Drosophila immigrans]|nr:hypothetical protein KR044_003361 [Drosophila immigrans]
MAANMKQSLALMLLLNVMLSPIVSANQVKSLGGVLDNLAGLVVCLEQNSVDILVNLLSGCTGNILANVVVTALTPILTLINAVLNEILTLVKTIVTGPSA